MAELTVKYGGLGVTSTPGSALVLGASDEEEGSDEGWGLGGAGGDDGEGGGARKRGGAGGGGADKKGGAAAGAKGAGKGRKGGECECMCSKG